VEVFEEIHRSNMSKLDADGKPIYREDGKIMKSDRYFLPDIESVLCK
jgi:predicted HAD superfamily Cof-like phosphohydrolase